MWIVKTKVEIPNITIIYRERKDNSDGPAPLCRFDVKDQSNDHGSKTVSGSFSCCSPETRGEGVSWVYFCVYIPVCRKEGIRPAQSSTVQEA